MSFFRHLSCLLVVAFVACGDDDLPMNDVGTDTSPDVLQVDGGSDVGEADTGTDTHVEDARMDASVETCEGAAASCVDDQFTALVLYDTVNEADVTNVAETNGFTSTIDVRGGGRSPTESFVYVRFTDTGLERADVSDDSAFESTGWDLSARRYQIKLNSGVSGPGCAEAGRLPSGTEFDSVTEVPSGFNFEREAYFDEGCNFVPDDSGIGGPRTRLYDFWTYTGCVSMTGTVYLIKTGDGRTVKLRVDGYYPLEIQQMCDSQGQIPTPSMSGLMTLRWAFID